MQLLTKNANTKVDSMPPINPSHVFLGESLISGVLPKAIPKRYAKISFTMTHNCGNTNQ
jgi:hypothetical protein